MLDLSNETKSIVKVLFTEQYTSIVAQLLIEECGNNIPFCEKHTPEKMERTRYSVLKISNGSIDSLKSAIELAKIDWRDVLMNAGFGDDTKKHKKWAKKLLAAKGNDI